MTRTWLAVAVIIATGIGLFAPFIDNAWTANESNAGTFYGAFNANYERFGFFEMYGLEAAPIALEMKYAIGYLNHPPAMAWLVYFAGMEEWQMRLPTVVSVIVLALLAFVWFRRKIDTTAAAAAGVAIILPPTMSVHGQISYELTTAVLGFGMILAFDRVLRRDGFEWWTTLVIWVCGLWGPWFDWSFLYVYCPSLLALMWRRTTLKRGAVLLAMPAAAASTGLALLMGWHVLVKNAPHLPPIPDNQDGLLEIYLRTWHEFQERGVWASLRGTWNQIWNGFTPTLLLVAALGVLPALRRSPREFAVLAFAFVHPAMFPSHTFDHAMFFVYAAPLVALCAAHTVVVAGEFASPRARAAVRAAVIAVALVHPAYSAWTHLANTRYSFYEDFGTVMSEAVEHDNWFEDDDEPRGYNVGHGWPYNSYTAYITSPRVFPIAVLDAEVLAASPAGGAPRGLRYVWFRYGERRGFTRYEPGFEPDPAMERLLEPFPKRRIPELEVTLDVSGRGDTVEIAEAWLVTLREPDPR